MKNKLLQQKRVTKRVEIGHAWSKQGAKIEKFTSGFITPEGVRLLNLIVKQTNKRVNFYLLPNPTPGLTVGQPNFLVFVPYWVLHKDND